MTQEDKELLLKDLCARLPYGVMVHYCNKSHTLYTNDFVLNERLLLEFRTPDKCVELKPYLRLMSSMTLDEIYEFRKFSSSVKDPDKIWESIPNYAAIDWLNAHHFDFRYLIEGGLAIEAPEGMYNSKTE